MALTASEFVASRGLGPTIAEGLAADGSSFLGGFGASLFSGATREFVGADASPEVQAFRTKNPIAGIISGLGGFLLPSIPLALLSGGAGTAVQLGRLGSLAKAGSTTAKVLGGVGKTTGAVLQGQKFATPVLSRSAQIATQATFEEISRLAISGGVELAGFDADPGRVLSDLPINIGAAGLLGAGFAGVGQLLSASARNINKGESLIAKTFPDAYNPSLSPQDRMATALDLRMANEQMLGLPENSVLKNAFKEVMYGKKFGLRDTILSQTPKAGIRAYVRRLDGESTKDFQRSFNQWFKPTVRVRADNKIKSRFLDESDKGFASKEALEEFVEEMNLPLNWVGKTLYPRAVFIESATESRKFAKDVTDKMYRLDEDFYYKRESGTGLYVAAKRNPRNGDQWMLFKTDDLGAFNPNAEAWKKASEVNWTTGNEFYTVPRGMNRNKSFSEQVAIANSSPRNIPINHIERKSLGSALDKLIPPRINKQVRSLAGEASTRLFGAHFSPALFRFADWAPAAVLWRKIRGHYEVAESSAIFKFIGQKAEIFKEGEAVFKGILRARPAGEGGIHGLVNRMGQKDIESFNSVVGSTGGVKTLAERNLREEGITPLARKLVTELQRVDHQMIREYDDVIKYTGDTPLLKPIEDHLMMSRSWEGNVRLPLFIEGQSQPVYIVGARSKKQAKELGESVLETMKERGLKMKPLEEANIVGRLEDAETIEHITRMNGADLTTTRTIHDVIRDTISRDPGRFKLRSGIGGFSLPKSRKELNDKLYSSIREMEREKAKVLQRHLYRDEMATLTRTRPDLAKDMQGRVSLLNGEQTGFSKWTNDIVDNNVGKFFPQLGKNGATRISGAINNAMFNLTLGSFDVGFAAMNAVTFLQTVIPEVSFVLSANPTRLAGLYETGMIPTAQGMRAVSFMTPMKLTAQAFKNLSKPSKGLIEDLNRAVSDKTVAPAVSEAFIGRATEALKFKEVVRGNETFVDYIQGLSAYMPTKSEEFARVHAFTTGRILGEMLEMEGDKLYQFSKRFTERTMYLYDQPSRASLITGPVGGAFGLFKNWSMHYLSNFGHYMGEGFNDANWAPLLWSMAGTGSIAGVGGIPLAFVAEKFSETFTGQGIMENIYSASGYKDFGVIGGTASDVLYYGLPALLGVTLQGRTEAPSADPMRDLTMLTSVAFLDRFKAAGKAIGEGIDFSMATGNLPTSNPRFMGQVMRAVAPRTLYRALQAKENGVLTSINTGSHIIKTSGAAQFANAIGFTPLEMQKAYDLSTFWKKDQDAQKATVTQLGKLAGDLLADGDIDGYTKVILGAALVEGVPIDSVIKSAAAFSQLQGAFGQETDVLIRTDRVKAILEREKFGL